MSKKKNHMRATRHRKRTEKGRRRKKTKPERGKFIAKRRAALMDQRNERVLGEVPTTLSESAKDIARIGKEDRKDD